MLDNHSIKKIVFNKDFRCYKAGEMFEFKAGINLLVGNQGCGKSSMFYSIMNWQESGIAMDYNPESSYRFLDTEKMNPRLADSFKAHQDFKSVNEYQKAESDAVIQRLGNGYNEQSHGQVMLPLLLTKKEKGLTYFIDEPEAGLSIRSQYELLKHIKEVGKDTQLIIATHSLVLIQEIGEVLSLEHKRWMPSQEFIESQKV
jgi:predicted ATPase